MALHTLTDLDRLAVWAEAVGLPVAELAQTLRTGANLGAIPADLPIVVAANAAATDLLRSSALPAQREPSEQRRTGRRDASRHGLLVGYAPNGKAHRYLPAEKLSTEEFRSRVLDLWCEAGFYEDDVTFTDHRVGVKGLEAGGQHFAPGVLRLQHSAPGYSEVRTKSGSPAWVANAFFNDRGEVVIRIGHEYERFWREHLENQD